MNLERVIRFFRSINKRWYSITHDHIGNAYSEVLRLCIEGRYALVQRARILTRHSVSMLWVVDDGCGTSGDSKHGGFQTGRGILHSYVRYRYLERDLGYRRRPEDLDLLLVFVGCIYVKPFISPICCPCRVCVCVLRRWVRIHSQSYQLYRDEELLSLMAHGSSITIITDPVHACAIPPDSTVVGGGR